MHDNCTVNGYVYKSSDNPRHATEAEIETCIKALSPVQINVVMTNAVFKPVMDAVINASVKMDDDASSPAEGTNDNDVLMSDGRTISMEEE